MRLFIAIRFTNEIKDELQDVMDSLWEQGVRANYTLNFGNLLFIGLQENKALKQYVRNLRAALTDYGIDFDRKPFRPHITIARKVEGRGQFSLSVEPETMTAERVSLIRSDRVNGRLRYTEIR